MSFLNIERKYPSGSFLVPAVGADCSTLKNAFFNRRKEALAPFVVLALGIAGMGECIVE